MVDGRRVSVTRSTEKECVAAAAELKAGLKQEADPERITVGRAMDKYIELKTPVLSPSTIAGYKRIRKNLMQDLMGNQSENAHARKDSAIHQFYVQGPFPKDCSKCARSFECGIRRISPMIKTEDRSSAEETSGNQHSD